MKSIVKALGVAGIAACFATAAAAGGFSFGSAGGNQGKWAYGDGAAFGGAEVSGFHGGSTYSESYGDSATSKSSCHYCADTTTAHAASGNQSGFSGFGIGHAQSHSGAVAGSGVGDGYGFKLGDFNKGN